MVETLRITYPTKTNFTYNWYKTPRYVKLVMSKGQAVVN